MTNNMYYKIALKFILCFLFVVFNLDASVFDVCANLNKCLQKHDENRFLSIVILSFSFEKGCGELNRNRKVDSSCTRSFQIDTRL